MTSAASDVDARALQMSDEERETYLTDRGWRYVGAGWIPPTGLEHEEMGGVAWLSQSGMYSLSTAIREQLAREDSDASPDLFGRYYHGSEPRNTLGRRS
jgi:hypothetical protein